MVELIKHIEGIVGTAAKRSTLKARGSICAIDIRPLKNMSYVAIDIDALDNKCIPSIKGRRCDYLIIVDRGNFYLVLPVEFKKTIAKSGGKVKRQIEGGLKIFESLTLDQKLHNERIKWVPCCLARSASKIYEPKDKDSVEFRGKKKPYITIKCGKDFFSRVEEQIPAH